MDFPQQEEDLITGQKPNDHCAVVGVISPDQAYGFILSSLKSLQHRGQESAGIAAFDGSMMKVKKGMGLVNDVFSDKDNPISGNVGIGHTRYSTMGTKTIENAGPFVISSASGYLAISHNGEITNADLLSEELKRRGATFSTSTDTEVMLMEFSKEIADNGLVNGMKIAMSKLRGAYSAAFMIDDRLFAIRDPLGIRPLILGKAENTYIVASESCAMDVLGGEIIRDVLPGEVVELTLLGPKRLFLAPSHDEAHCMFEYVYFARPDSIIDNIEVFETRIKLGRFLAGESTVEADVVIPVPDSGRAQALGFSQQSGIVYSEGLIKNRYSGRTFIMPSQAQRTASIKMKLNAIRSVVDGKRVVLVDDSIVRGNTMKHIVSLLRKAGATEVHVRIGSPQIVAPCYFGVDMKTKDQFIARGKTVEEINREIGADSLAYISIEGLVRSIGMERKSLCLGCLTAEYPVSIPGEKYLYQRDLTNY
ncbi:MAG: amidophosphoribosyltransferase [Thermoplasmataceae archaeon]